MMMYGRKTKAAELAERYRNELLAKRAPKDSPVMSGRELAEHFGVSAVTANRVLNLLVEEDVLYRKPKSGSFLKHDPPVIPTVVYAGPLPEPRNANPILNDASFRLLNHFAELGLEPKLIPYHKFRQCDLAERELENADGLLIHDSFIDEATLKTLWRCSCPVVLAGNMYIEDRFPCSQVIPDFTESLRKFHAFRPFESYEKIILVEAQHSNSKASSESSRRIPARTRARISFRESGHSRQTVRDRKERSPDPALPSFRSRCGIPLRTIRRRPQNLRSRSKHKNPPPFSDRSRRIFRKRRNSD